MPIKWRVYYDNGDTFDGDQPPECRTGVICVVQADPSLGREILDRSDWYYLKQDPDGPRWYGADLPGLLDQIVYFIDRILCVVQGRMIRHADYERIIIRACDEPGLPPRSAIRKRK